MNYFFVFVDVYLLGRVVAKLYGMLVLLVDEARYASPNYTYCSMDSSV